MPSRGVIKSGVKSDKGARPKETVVGDQSAGGGGNPEVVVVDETMEGHTCKTCRGPDTEDMVQCDRCDGWFHFSCVGVSEEVADKSWSCTNCVTAKWIQRTKTALEESALHRKENIGRYPRNLPRQYNSQWTQLSKQDWINRSINRLRQLTAMVQA
ncbi:uncharacterized protein LOC134286189 [Aedes albopictus]|uniref:PHD-type domain-containing protein n=1 Tax=Aedes albopictus TaxID=7160 RepID=A0ABM2A545_AEDAL